MSVDLFLYFILAGCVILTVYDLFVQRCVIRQREDQMLYQMEREAQEEVDRAVREEVE